MFKRYLSALVSFVIVVSLTMPSFAESELVEQQNPSENINAIEQKSFQEFISQERPFNKNETALADESFICTLENHQLTIKNQNTGEIYVPVKESVNTFWRFGNIIYINGFDTGIIQFNLDTKISDILYGDNDISSLYLNPDIAYFIKDSAIHRLHLPSKRDDIVYQGEDIISCEPESTEKLLIKKINPEWSTYLEETGDYNNNANIPEYLCYIYDISTQQTTPYTWETVESPDDIPMSRISYGGYGPDTYFTSTGTSDATCHSQGICNYPQPSGCKCKVYGASIQCMAYAHYVFDQSRAGTWGNNYNRTITLSNASAQATADSYAKLDQLFLRDLESGADIRMMSLGHSFAFGSVKGSGSGTNKTVTGYQVNYAENSCKVTTAAFDYNYLIRQGTIKSHG